MMRIVSACLVGLNCRYDGSNCPNGDIARVFRDGKVLPVCPEQLGGLPVPRIPSEIEHGNGADVLAGKSRVLNARGEDVTIGFICGAWRTLALARAMGITEGIVKAHSPSCGVTKIKRRGRLVDGPGVLAALLLKQGISLRER
jgi:uncharacterized protein YbbK (DUF523 family)